MRHLIALAPAAPIAAPTPTEHDHDNDCRQNGETPTHAAAMTGLWHLIGHRVSRS